MSQITRCPSCTTLFKVVPDQLRISDGWVRCGHCQEVFDATLSLQESASPLPLPEPNAEGPVAASEDPVAAAPSGDVVHGVAALDASLDIEAPFVQPQEAEPDKEAQRSQPLEATDTQGATPVSKPALSSNSAAGDEQTSEQAAVLPSPDLALDQPESSPPEMLTAGYELPAALMNDSDSEEHRATEAASDEFPLHPPLPAAPEKSSAAPAAGLWEAPFTPSFKAASLAQDGDDKKPDRQPSTYSDAFGTKKTDSKKKAQNRSKGTSHVVEQGQTSRHVPSTEPASETQGVAEAPPEDAAPLLPEVEDEPSFVRSARRKAVWHRPGVRFSLGAIALLLSALLLLQWAVQQRNYLASARPQWRPALDALCVPLKCELGPYQHIASVVVDSSAFNKLRGNTYRFALALKNQSVVPVALPAVELTLTDTSDQPLLRRVLTPSELAAPAALPAGGEWSGSLEMEVDAALAGEAAAQIAGYRVLVFYP